MSKQMFDLSGKVALITGAGKGLGFSMAKGLGDVGATVIINDLFQGRIDDAVEKLKEAGVNAYGSLFDVTDVAAIEKQVAQIEGIIGPIDILVNNAGIIPRGLMVDLDDKDWEATLKVNLTGVFRITRCVARYMIKRKSGKIINMNSMMSELGRPNVSAYAASKGGLKMLTKNMTAEWGQYNIQANGIGPGYFDTELTKPLQENEEFHNYLMKRTPAKRWGKPEDLVGPAIFLASDASNFVNGHILYVDGGILANF